MPAREHGSRRAPRGTASPRCAGSPKRLGQKATNKEIRYRFRCTLARGVYRFSVYATNLAGLKQLKTASNRLTVQ